MLSYDSSQGRNSDMKPITGAVGRGGRNHPGDVRIVQGALNDNIAKITPFAFLRENGACDQTLIQEARQQEP